MLESHKLVEKRIENYLRTVIEPAVFSDRCDLEVAVAQVADPVSFDEARRLAYAPVAPGFRWGPLFSTAWFRLRGVAPALRRDGQVLHLLFDTATEACLFHDGVPWHGLSRFHRDCPLPPSIRPGEPFELWVEAACNGLWGDFDLDKTVVDGKHGHLTLAQIGVFHGDDVYQLAMDFDFLLSLLRALPESMAIRGFILDDLNRAMESTDSGDVQRDHRFAQSLVKIGFDRRSPHPGCTPFVIGHAHIDTAWLWPLRETRRKLYRTFSTALRNMERYEEFRFLHTSPAQYEMIRQDQPSLFEQIKRRVAEGRWIPEAAMWVEGDTYIAGGEAIIRQILHGTRWLREHFDFTPRTLWIPDNFGYCAALPQIMAQCGLELLVTQKLSWNDTNRFPHYCFTWRGLDGTGVATHFLPAGQYNSECRPDDLIECRKRFEAAGSSGEWLYAFGHGDGGGGPHRDMLERLRRAAGNEESPKPQFADRDEMVERLKFLVSAPIWDGELYLELHRGCFTTQASAKRDNRECEQLLRDAEIAACLATGGFSPDQRSAMDRAWKGVLLNQFHDILCGTSIARVHAEAGALYGEVRAAATAVLQESLTKWNRRVEDGGRPAGRETVVNLLSWQRDGVVQLAGDHPPTSETALSQGAKDDDGNAVTLAVVKDVPAIGHLTLGGERLGADAPAAANQFTVTQQRIENSLIAVDFVSTGRVIRLTDKRCDYATLTLNDLRIGNWLVAYEDRPAEYDAWNIDRGYGSKRIYGERYQETRATVEETGPVRASVRLEIPIGRASMLTQWIRLYADSPILHFDTMVDWREDCVMLRTNFSVGLRARYATYGTQFGAIERPIHENTSWDAAQFEHCAQRWVDVSQPDYGVALLFDTKYGCSCRLGAHGVRAMGSTLGLTLLRSPMWPDPTADRGIHRFRYGLYPHAGDWRTARVPQMALEFGSPLRVVAGGGEPDATGKAAADASPLPPVWSAVSCDARSIVIETIKPAEEGDDIILRLYDTFGQSGRATVSWRTGWTAPRVVDMLERPREHHGVREAAEGRGFVWDYHPYEILTVAVKPGT
jgi:alpha-mannosidase